MTDNSDPTTITNDELKEFARSLLKTDDPEIAERLRKTAQEFARIRRENEAENSAA